MDPVLDVAEWAGLTELVERTGMSRHLAYKWIKAGRMPAQMVNTTWFVPREWLDTHVDQLRTWAQIHGRMHTEATGSMTVKELADYLGVSRQSVLRRIDAGVIPAKQIGRMWYVPRSWVAERLGGLQLTDPAPLPEVPPFPPPNGLSIDQRLAQIDEKLDQLVTLWSG